MTSKRFRDKAEFVSYYTSTNIQEGLLKNIAEALWSIAAELAELRETNLNVEVKGMPSKSIGPLNIELNI